MNLINETESEMGCLNAQYLSYNAGFPQTTDLFI